MRPSLPFLAASLALAAGCSHPPPRAPAKLHSVDEPRAVAIMAQSMREAGLTPAGGRPIQLVTGKRVQIEVTPVGKQWGLAYLTADEAAQLRPDVDYLPAHGDDLPVVMGFGPDADVVVCLLFAHDYAFDDDVTQERAQTHIGAERKLARDTRDFIVQAGLHHLK